MYFCAQNQRWRSTGGHAMPVVASWGEHVSCLFLTVWTDRRLTKTLHQCGERFQRSALCSLDGHNDGFWQRISTLGILLLGVLFICFVVSLGLFKHHFSFWSVIELDSCRPLLSLTWLMFRVCSILESNSPNTPLPLLLYYLFLFHI